MPKAAVDKPRSLPPLYLPDEPTRLAFQKDLLEWYGASARDLPWRRTRDPYLIWISEVMLQQTRVDQAWSYYERFARVFPTVQALAAAPLDDLLRQWEGLGYYSRARNLHRAAQEIVERFGGAIPAEYEAFRSLPGVGPYTAAAVLSIAYGHPYAVLDGNVARVLARVFQIEEDVKDGATKRLLQSLADALLAREEAGAFNQAVMELGATVCVPRGPRCSKCPLQDVCRARAAGEQERYPVTRSKAPTPHFDVAVGLVFDEQGRVLIQRRPDEGLLGGLWEFPGGKREDGETPEDTCRRELKEELGIDVAVDRLLCRVAHAYTHFKITLYAYVCRLVAGTPQAADGKPVRWVSHAELSDYAFPRANRHVIAALEREQTHPSLFG